MLGKSSSRSSRKFCESRWSAGPYTLVTARQWSKVVEEKRVVSVYLPLIHKSRARDEGSQDVTIPPLEPSAQLKMKVLATLIDWFTDNLI